MNRKIDVHSLKYRDKASLADMHETFMNYINHLPKTYFKHSLSKLLSEKIPHSPLGFADALAEHLLDNPSNHFEWAGDDGEDRQIDLNITVDDLTIVLGNVERLVQEKTGDITQSLIEGAGDILLKSLKEDWAAQKEHDDTRINQFRSNLLDRWGCSFNTLRMIYTISLEMGTEIEKEQRRSRSKRNRVLRETLVRLHARACQVFMEMIVLMENGLADGAMARWRTLHEITVVASLLFRHGEDLAVRYRAHAAIEAKRAVDRFIKNHEALEFEPLEQWKIDTVEENYKSMLMKYGDNFGSEYGWAAQHLEMKKPRLVDLEAAVGKMHHQSFYRMASYNVHATAKGIDFRLGLMDGAGSPIALAGPSNAGFVDPAQMMAHDLVHITSLLGPRNFRFDRMVGLEILARLRNELSVRLRWAQRQLDRAHQRQLKLEAEEQAKVSQKAAKRRTVR